jgi:UDP-N-acetylmuramoyl-L-alanyl-D-glutamate--2,6-diaminopimelate ligase
MPDYPSINLETLVAELAVRGIGARLENADPEAAATVVDGCASDSRHVRPGNLFICKGAAFKPAYLASAAEKGATSYLCAEGAYEACHAAAPELPAVVVDDVRAAMEVAAPIAWHRPDRALRIVGVTGTKGKSSATWMLRSILDAAPGPKTAYIGSIETYDGVERFESVNTTPEAPDLWRHLANARESGLGTAIVEVSSQALKYGRVAGVEFEIGCFLNIGLDHISPAEHADFEDYLSSKLRIFESSDHAVVNALTKDYARVRAAAVDAGCALTTFANGSADADAWADGVAPSTSGIAFSSHSVWYGDLELELSMGGLFNVDNALAALSCAGLLGVDAQYVKAGLAACSIPGRMQTRASKDGDILAIVDYAHNELSFETFFSSLRAQHPDAYVISYFGAGGGKALDRRVDLPRIASKASDLVILTSDDPGPEEAADICEEMAANVENGVPVRIETDREKATDLAFSLALEKPGHPTIICALGKGNETLMHVGNEFIPYEDDWSRLNRLVDEAGL